MIVNFETVQLLCPEIILIAMASWIYVAGAFQQSRIWWTTFSLIVYAVVAVFMLWSESALSGELAAGNRAFSGPIIADYFGYMLRWLALLVGALFTLIATRNRGNLVSEYLATLMLLVVGLMLVARANELVLMFLGLELISIPTYVLLYLGRRDRANSEAAVKYFYLSILSAALFLYGMSFLYGIAGTTMIVADGNESVRSIQAASSLATGTLAVDEIATDTSPEESVGSLGLAPLAFVLMFAGLGFKIAAVPFHFYAPDVYQGTTNANAGLLAVAPKIAGVVAIIRLLVLAMPAAAEFAWQVAVVLAMVTMTIGNVSALWQNNIRRLMAYSSIAHAGYMLIGISVAFAANSVGAEGATGGISATLLYVVVYVLASAGVFAALAYLGSWQREISSVDELAGLGRDRPASGAALAICMFSLAGIPPLAGFWGKFALFTSAIGTASGSSSFSIWFAVLAVVGALNAAVAAAYYLRVIGVMYFRPSQGRLVAEGGWGARLAMSVCALALVAVGVYPRGVAGASQRAERSVPFAQARVQADSIVSIATVGSRAKK